VAADEARRSVVVEVKRDLRVNRLGEEWEAEAVLGVEPQQKMGDAAASHHEVGRGHEPVFDEPCNTVV
jgi:hypothetical protein